MTEMESVVTSGPLDGVKHLLLWTDPGVSALAFVLGLVALRRGINIAPVRAPGNPKRERERDLASYTRPASVHRTAVLVARRERPPCVSEVA